MPDLGGWDGAIIISGQLLADLAVTLDAMAQATLANSQPTTQYGLQYNEMELKENAKLLVPRLLYATINPAFAPDDAEAQDSLERLHARLKEYVRLTDVEWEDFRSPTVIGDPGNRLTFLREPWFDEDHPPDIALHPLDTPADTLRITFGGRVYVGANFVDGATAATSSFTFTISLDYRVRILDSGFLPADQLGLGLGSLPFRTLPPPAGCAPPAGQRLPPYGAAPVWAQKTDEVRDGAAVWRLTTQADIQDGDGTLFTGAPGDILLDADDNARWLVADVAREAGDDADGLQSRPRRVLLDTTCLDDAGVPIPMAESARGYAGLVFDGISNLEITGLHPLEPDHRDAIDRSIMKVDGFLLGFPLDQQFQALCELLPGACPPPPSLQDLALLALLGEHGMDCPLLLPGELMLPMGPSYIQDAEGDYVASDALIFYDAAVHVFEPLVGHSGAIALGGMFTGRPPPAGSLPEDFSNGQDLAVGLSQAMVDRWLTPSLLPSIQESLDDNVPGFDAGDLAFRVTLADNRINIRLEGSGAIDLGFMDLPFGFTVGFPIRFRPQPAILRLDDPDSQWHGWPISALQDPLSDDLSCVGINILEGDLAATSPDGNPLCFAGYIDPRIPGADPESQPMGPWIRVSGDTCPACELLSDLCPSGPLVDPAYLWTQRNFAVPPFNSGPDDMVIGLMPVLEVAFVPPHKNDVDIDVDLAWWAEVLTAVVVAPLVGLPTLDALWLTSVLADMVAFQLVQGGLRSGVASQIPLTMDLSFGLQCFLQQSDPALPSNDAITIDSGAMCLRFRVLTGPLADAGNSAS